MSDNDQAGTWGSVGDDVVGCASARLLAAGVARRDRLQALRLLGVLDSQADAGGTVRRPLADLAGEFDLDPIAAERWLEQLVLIGVVGRVGERLALAGREPAAASGLRLADFLASAATVLDTEADAEVAPAPVVHLDERRRASRPLAAAGAAAATVALIAGFLGAGRALDDDRRTAPAAASGPVTSSVSSPESLTGAVPGAATDVFTGATGGLAGEAGRGVVTGEAGSPTAPTVIAVDGDCPAKIPTARVITVTADTGRDASTGLTTWTVLVTGALENPAEEAAAVSGAIVTLEVAGSLLEVIVPGLPEVVEGGQEYDWEASVPVGPSAPELGPATAELAWQWRDDGLAGSCPT